MKRQTTDRPATYEIRVQGQIDEHWLEWFSGTTMTSDGHTTTLTSTIPDQATLRGILIHLWDLNLTLISVAKIDEKGKEDR